MKFCSLPLVVDPGVAGTIRGFTKVTTPPPLVSTVPENPPVTVIAEVVGAAHVEVPVVQMNDLKPYVARVREAVERFSMGVPPDAA